ncbi:DUF5017 domain-containing protein [Flavobacterium sp. UMI-01]|uniref:DUF5017 domain-containing protein n=1 Tax=Flavobacterium sp. UMI-01 TaxID=1441053 RepID=UPI001C7D5887|nr:DUF5017 domain-containing protein [Flavobacterium sp. UMI-01]
MKKIIFTIMMLGIIATSCSDIEVETPSFEARLDKLNYKAGDTVRFSFSGKTDYLYFFSGELGKEYSKRSIFENDVNGNAEFSFNSNVSGGTVGVNNIRVLVSNDFNSVYDKTNVQNATWVDITDKVVLGTTTTNVASGVVDLSPYQAEGKPLFIAYRYVGSNTQTTAQRTWTIGAFSFKTKHADGEVYVNATSVSNATFTNVTFDENATQWTVNSASLTHVGLAAGNLDDDDWVISSAINLKTAIGDATGVVTLRTLNTGFTPSSFEYVYQTPGTYKATVAAVNATSQGRKDKVTEFTIVVE